MKREFCSVAFSARLVTGPRLVTGHLLIRADRKTAA